MQGIVNFASQVGLIFASLLPPICYLGALGTFIYACWAFWRQAQPDNPFRDRPWLPALSLFFCGLLASFDRFLTRANRSFGSSVTVGLTDMVSYTPTGTSDATTFLGANPGETIVNVVTLFELFFQAFGALACVLAAVFWYGTMKGTSDRSRGGCGVQFVSGIALINVVTISQWVVNTFKIT